LRCSCGADEGSRQTHPLRVVHGASALLLPMGALAMHLANHLVALWTVPANQAFMKVLRLWYRGGCAAPTSKPIGSLHKGGRRSSCVTRVRF